MPMKWRPARAWADKLNRFNALALVCVLCAWLSACSAPPSAPTPTKIALHLSASDAQPALRMIPASSEHGLVYRYQVQGLKGPAEVSLVVGGEPIELTVSPHQGQAVVEYRPDERMLVQLPGTWHLFAYKPAAGDRFETLCLAGSFNGWSTHALPMFDRGDGVYVALVKLSEGVHWYKFVEDGGKKWINDPASDKQFERPDGNYGVNSAVLVGVDARGLAPPQPNHINASAIVHDPSDVPDLTVASASLLRISIRVQAGDVQHVSVLICPGPDERGAPASWKHYGLEPSGEKVGLERYGALVQVSRSPVSYVFELVDGNATRYWCKRGLVESRQAACRSPFECVMDPGFKTPDWAKDALWYQIFPERFRNGDPSNDPPKTQRWRANWWSTLPGEVPGKENFYGGAGNVWFRRFGGDIQGIREALPYLRRLGVNTLYLNPVFEARSMHKYDTSDFRHIDDNFTVKYDPSLIAGETLDPATWVWTPGDKLFLDFVKEAHRQGFKIVLDGVFNHVGEDHFAFRDVLKHGKASKYADWFEITDWGHGGPPGKPGGIQWRGWDHDNGQLPLLKRDPVHGLADGPRHHIFDITRRWMAPNGDPSAGIDGWRLDVAPDIPHPFWVEWRRLVKSINPDAILIGEIWTWAQPWLEGDQLDGATNYQFAIPSQDFFVDVKTAISPSEYSTLLNQLVYAYPLQSALVMFNLLDSHDTDRLASMFVNPDRGYDTANRLQDTGPDYSLAKPDATQRKRMKQEIVCQMTFVGAPMIYYGDEAGMWGPDDPSNRQPMIWRDLLPYDDPNITFDRDLFGWYQRMTTIRLSLAPLRRGFFRTLIADDKTGVLAYARDLDNDHVYVVLNRSDKTRTVELDLAKDDRRATLIDWLDPKQVRVEMDNAQDADARPRLIVKPGAAVPDDPGARVTLKIPAYGSAVLSDRDLLR